MYNTIYPMGIDTEQYLFIWFCFLRLGKTAVDAQPVPIEHPHTGFNGNANLQPQDPPEGSINQGSMPRMPSTQIDRNSGFKEPFYETIRSTKVSNKPSNSTISSPPPDYDNCFTIMHVEGRVNTGTPRAGHDKPLMMEDNVGYICMHGSRTTPHYIEIDNQPIIINTPMRK